MTSENSFFLGRYPIFAINFHDSSLVFEISAQAIFLINVLKMHNILVLMHHLPVSTEQWTTSQTTMPAKSRQSAAMILVSKAATNLVSALLTKTVQKAVLKTATSQNVDRTRTAPVITRNVATVTANQRISGACRKRGTKLG